MGSPWVGVPMGEGTHKWGVAMGGGVLMGGGSQSWGIPMGWGPHRWGS